MFLLNPAAIYSVRNVGLAPLGFPTPYSAVITITRISDNATADAYDNGAGLVLADNTTLISTWLAGSQARVTTWWDQSGNFNHATQPDPAQQPLLFYLTPILPKVYFKNQAHSLLISGSQPTAYGAFCTFTAMSLGSFGTVRGRAAFDPLIVAGSDTGTIVKFATDSLVRTR